MCRNPLQPQCDRSTGPRRNRRSRADRRSDERLGLLFTERSAPALRPRPRDPGRPRGSDLALRRKAVASGREGQSGIAHRGRTAVNARVMWLMSVAACCAICAAGLQFTYVETGFTQANSPTSRKYLPETMGGGVALLDYDNDGRLDIFFVNGAKIEDPMRPGALPDKSDRKYWNRLYHQN